MVVSVAGGTVHGLFPSQWYSITSSGQVNVQFWFFIHYQPGIQGSAIDIPQKTHCVTWTGSQFSPKT
ncbi:hypothetical protein T09_638 [Trichinella sp. T9]|nr:hypothetical protein T09_638 [Trichinella sp. T9]